MTDRATVGTGLYATAEDYESLFQPNQITAFPAMLGVSGAQGPAFICLFQLIKWHVSIEKFLSTQGKRVKAISVIIRLFDVIVWCFWQQFGSKNRMNLLYLYL